MRMKRTNLVLDEQLLDTATRLLGARTYSAAVNQALAEVIRLVQIRGMVELVGQGVWEGDLSEMREDAAPRPRPARRRLPQPRAVAQSARVGSASRPQRSRPHKHA